MGRLSSRVPDKGRERQDEEFNMHSMSSSSVSVSHAEGVTRAKEKELDYGVAQSAPPHQNNSEITPIRSNVKTLKLKQQNTLARMWNKGNSLPLLKGVQTSTTTWKINLVVSQRTENNSTSRPSNDTTPRWQPSMSTMQRLRHSAFSPPKMYGLKFHQT